MQVIIQFEQSTQKAGASASKESNDWLYEIYFSHNYKAVSIKITTKQVLIKKTKSTC